MWEVNCEESSAPKNWCFWTVVLEKTLVSPLDCKENKPVNPKGNQSWIFTERSHAETETPIPWPPHAKNWLLGKDPDAGKDWRLEKGTAEDETVGWHHWLDGREFEQVLGVGDGQGGLVCCSPWGHTESATTELVNWTTSCHHHRESQVERSSSPAVSPGITPQGRNYREWTHQLLDPCAWKQCMHVAYVSLDKTSHVTTPNFKGA